MRKKRDWKIDERRKKSKSRRQQKKECRGQKFVWYHGIWLLTLQSGRWWRTWRSSLFDNKIDCWQRGFPICRDLCNSVFEIWLIPIKNRRVLGGVVPPVPSSPYPRPSLFPYRRSWLLRLRCYRQAFTHEPGNPPRVSRTSSPSAYTPRTTIAYWESKWS